ncbi:MAG: glutamate 5-kinase [Dysgonamonadaceae bacterium]|jgi:glutamate 5-kinase|nr:glutamate 5-kinase [Dysgonamonadaceae bacterium]
MESKTRYRRIVVKIGSNVLAAPSGTLDAEQVAMIVSQISAILRQGIEVIVVSSGAVASGRGELAAHTHFHKLDSIAARQLFSAVGQVKLMDTYYHLFNNQGIICGQVLTTKESLSTRSHYLNQQRCMETMLAGKVVPIVNENDTISVTELMFTDNDELSGMIAAMMNADALFILSNVDGIYSGDPASPQSRLIPEITENTRIEDYISDGKSQFGRGGMLTKTRIARQVAGEGIEVVILNGRKTDLLEKLVLNPDSDTICTRFPASLRPVSGVKKWLAHSEDFAKGILRINEGAFEALTSPKATSLLPVGVTAVEGHFEKDDIVRIVSPAGQVVGLGRVAVSSEKAAKIIGKKGGKPLVHYDYMHLG